MRKESAKHAQPCAKDQLACRCRDQIMFSRGTFQSNGVLSTKCYSKVWFLVIPLLWSYLVTTVQDLYGLASVVEVLTVWRLTTASSSRFRSKFWCSHGMDLDRCLKPTVRNRKTLSLCNSFWMPVSFEWIKQLTHWLSKIQPLRDSIRKLVLRTVFLPPCLNVCTVLLVDSAGYGPVAHACMWWSLKWHTGPYLA